MPAAELPFVSETADGWYLSLRVQPGAKKNELAGVAENALRVRLCAPAVDNKANLALVEFLAKLLGIKKNKVTLVSGEKSRQKRLFIAAGTEPDWSALNLADNSPASSHS